MRFTGQIKLPDLDYPGLPAVVVVDGNQTELFVEGESLGRWSLVDVRAERLISNAFTLDLRGEEVTFLADQPTEFAYSGVDHMANVWAKHKAIRLPLRGIANGKSRRGTTPSRIGDLREAIEEALSGSSLNAFSGRVEEPTKVHKPAAAGTASTTPPASRTRIPASPPVTSEATSAESKFRPSDPAPSGRHTAEPPPPPAEVTEPQPETLPPIPIESIYRDSVPWAREGEKAAEQEPAKEEPAKEETATQEIGATPDLAEPATTRDRVPAPPQESQDPEDPSSSPDPSVPWIAPPAPEQVPSRVAAADAEPSVVVDLDAFDEPEEEVPAMAPASKPSPVESQAGPDSGKAGIMGAVRSAFVRTKTEHDHEYVEAPGGLGIKRQICAECGHISIGVAE